jgi:hypothetical protein
MLAPVSRCDPEMAQAVQKVEPDYGIPCEPQVPPWHDHLGLIGK